MRKRIAWIALIGGVFFAACNALQETRKELKVLGKVEEQFQFVNQDSQFVTNETVANKYYVTDFFFTTCPTICPKMKSQMVLLHDAFKDRDDFVLLSHSIDTRHDSVAVLREFADRLGVSSEKWHFVTGERDDIFNMAKHYMVSAMEDSSAAGGYIHSGAFILIDNKGQIRGYYDGTKPEETQELIADLNQLFDEEQP